MRGQCDCKSVIGGCWRRHYRMRLDMGNTKVHTYYFHGIPVCTTVARDRAFWDVNGGAMRGLEWQLGYIL